ncbi:MAG: hypothetical protein ACREKH_21655 [Candidatus Rokuibacteriota bacterium]
MAGSSRSAKYWKGAEAAHSSPWNPGLLERGREVAEGSEVFVVARLLAGQHGMQRVLEVVAPWVE